MFARESRREVTLNEHSMAWGKSFYLERRLTYSKNRGAYISSQKEKRKKTFRAPTILTAFRCLRRRGNICKNSDEDFCMLVWLERRGTSHEILAWQGEKIKGKYVPSPSIYKGESGCTSREIHGKEVQSIV